MANCGHNCPTCARLAKMSARALPGQMGFDGSIVGEPKRKRKMHENSLKAYADAQPRFSKTEAKVKHYIEMEGMSGSTQEQAALALGFRYSSMQRVFKQLCQKNVIVETGIDRPTTSGSDAAVYVRYDLKLHFPERGNGGQRN